MKQCISCNRELELSAFPPNKRNKDGLNYKCRECYNEYMRTWYQKNSDVHKTRVNSAREPEKYRANKYGLTVDEVQTLTSLYDGKCHLCQIRDAVAIDHDHKTGLVRGVLCNQCNTGLGKLGDSIEGLQKAMDYLSRVVRTV